MKSLGSGVAELKTSPLGFGCMGLTTCYGDRTEDQEAIKILRRAYDLGVRHFDTAQVYVRNDPDGSVYYNEDLIGAFIKSLSSEERATISVATKYFPRDRNGETKFNEEYFIELTKTSLKKLGVCSIDLYYFHRIFPKDVCPVEVWMGAAKKLVKKGFVKRIGLSEASVDVIKAAHAIHPITCVQQEWSLFARDLEKEIVPVCKELGIGIVSYSPLGRGFLAGSFAKKEDRPTDWRGDNIPYLSEKNIEKNFLILDKLKAFAKAKNCTLGQLCLSWIMAQGGIPIPGTAKLHHVEDNCGSTRVTLSEDEVMHLGKLGDQVVGQRGNKEYMQGTFHSC